MTTTGFIGVGTMGRPMARHVLAAAQPDDRVVLNALSPNGLEELLDAGARYASNAREVAQQCDVVVYMVPTMADIRGTLDGPDGLLAGLTPAPLLLIVSSTCSSAEVRDLARDLDEATGGRIAVVDAPVSGGAEGAEAGTLSVMVGGADADATRAVGLLSATGRAVHLGPLGAGQIAKACNQLIVAAEVVANAEAAVLAERSGMDVSLLFDLLLDGYATSRIMEVKSPRFIAHDHSPSGPAKFLVKDLRAFAEEAERVGMTTFSVEPLRAVFTGLTQAGLGDQDSSVVQAYIEQSDGKAPSA
ncbi:NAD(P)-dependent oxidoreductase [Nigerium massiliense]|uniref:NAD(P)-dependent oxidoreductase n=1 Tax=Nigerium massiliense TaxID=1522317 RepID=UPI0005909111|nr:NAD(P)-dependent oxidoreductase [Nigerium massiliense]